MMGFSGFGGNLEFLAYSVMALFALAFVIPLTLALIRLANRTWFDPDWRRGDESHVPSSRQRLHDEVREARKDFAEGRCVPATPDEIMREILK